MQFIFFSVLQVIVEKAPKARIGDLDKKKYLVPSDLTGEHCIVCQVQHLKRTSMVQLHVKCCRSFISGPVLLPHPEKNPLAS